MEDFGVGGVEDRSLEQLAVALTFLLRPTNSLHFQLPVESIGRDRKTPHFPPELIQWRS